MRASASPITFAPRRAFYVDRHLPINVGAVHAQAVITPLGPGLQGPRRSPPRAKCLSVSFQSAQLGALVGDELDSRGRTLGVVAR